MNAFKSIVAGVTQVGIALAALVVVIQVLFGQPFLTGDFVVNLMGLIKQIGDAGFIGLIALAVIIWIFAMARNESGPSGGGM